MTGAEEAREHPRVWERLDLVKDRAANRVGRVMDRVGPKYQLRGLAGGKEWEADVEELEAVSLAEALAASSAELNRRSEERAPRVW